MVLALPSIASAQWGGNDRYGNNRNIKQNVKNLKNRAKSFEKAVDRDDRNDRNRNRRGNWGGNWGNDDLEDLAEDFKKAADRLENKYGNGRNLNNSRDEARRVLDIASRIDRVINSRGGGNAASQWRSMRNDLSVVAQVYGYGNYRGNDRNNRNRNRNSNGGWFPFPF